MDENGCVKGARVIKMELGEPDASGRRSPVEIPGSEYEIEADTVIMSLGTSPNPLISSTTKGLETNRRKCIVAEEENGATSKSGDLPVEMPLQELQRSSWQWVQEKRLRRELTHT